MDDAETKCRAVLDALAGYADGELSAEDHAWVSRHLSACPDCAASHDAMSLARGAAGRLRRWTAPSGLRDRVTASLRAADRESRNSRAVHLGSVALAAIAAALVAAWLTWIFFAVPATDRLAAEAVLTAHVRSLLTPQTLTQVVASDPHQVKPWFAGKVAVAPNVRDLEADGFTLAGGRLDYLEGHVVAAFVYRRREHVINVFVGSADSALAASFGESTLQGYNLVRWRRNGLAYSAISDLNMTELKMLSERL